MGEEVYGAENEHLRSGMEYYRGSIMDTTIIRASTSTEKKKMEWAKNISNQEITESSAVTLFGYNSGFIVSHHTEIITYLCSTVEQHLVTNS